MYKGRPARSGGQLDTNKGNIIHLILVAPPFMKRIYHRTKLARKRFSYMRLYQLQDPPLSKFTSPGPTYLIVKSIAKHKYPRSAIQLILIVDVVFI